ncbi:hypothetical protein V6O07_13365, partial [Arthrospira platensis SPKY2]
TFSTMSRAERMFRKHCEERRRKREELVACFSIVLEAVHPAHWEVLPPSPKEMLYRAWLLGVSPSE